MSTIRHLAVGILRGVFIARRCRQTEADFRRARHLQVEFTQESVRTRREMRALIVEDDPTSRLILQRLLMPYGQADIAADGREGINAFRSAHHLGAQYDLVCLDIMLPGMDGQSVLRAVRSLEEEFGVSPGNGARVIMTTALNDKENLLAAIQQCDAYLIKPIDKCQLMFYLKRFGLIT
jgi:two-component system chemotaxis response regulator CheY